MITHYIYEIPGRKVGCTKNLKRRMRLYEDMEGVIPDIRVVEELHDKTDQEAGDIEWQWSDEIGYRRENHYTVIMIAAKERSRRGKEALTPEISIAAGKKGGFNKNVVLTDEQRSDIGRDLGKASALAKIERGEPNGFAAMPLERLREMSRNTGRLLAARGGTSMQRDAECPHCGRKGKYVNLRRWHFDNCPHKPRTSTTHFVRRAA